MGRSPVQSWEAAPVSNSNGFRPPLSLSLDHYFNWYSLAMAIFTIFIYGSWLLVAVCIHYLLLRRSIDTKNPQRIRLFPSLVIAYACALLMGYATLFSLMPIFLGGVHFALYVSGVALASFSAAFLIVLRLLQPSLPPKYIVATSGALWLAIAGVYFVGAVFLQEYLDEDFLFVASLATLSLPSVLGIAYWFNLSWQKAIIRFVISVVGIVSVIVVIMSVYAVATNGGRINASSAEWVNYTDVPAKFSLSYPNTLVPKSAIGDGEQYVRFYAVGDLDIPSISVTVAPAVRQFEPQLKAPLYRSCTDQVPMGVVDFQSRTLESGAKAEQFLDKSPDGVVGNYIFVARSEERCYIIRAVGPGYRMHMSDIERLFDSFLVI